MSRERDDLPNVNFVRNRGETTIEEGQKKVDRSLGVALQLESFAFLELLSEEGTGRREDASGRVELESERQRNR